MRYERPTRRSQGTLKTLRSLCASLRYLEQEAEKAKLTLVAHLIGVAAESAADEIRSRPSNQPRRAARQGQP